MLLSSIKKEIKIFMSDKSNIIIQLFMPLILIIFVTYALGSVTTTEQESKIAVPYYIAPNAVKSNVVLLKGFAKKNEVFLLEEGSSKEEIIKDLEKGTRRIGVVLEGNKFEILESTASMTAKTLVEGFTGALGQFYYLTKGIEMPQLPPPEYQLETKVVGKEGEWTPAAQFVPQFAIMFMFFLIMNMGKVILQEEENGTMKRLIAAPISSASLLVSKLIPYFILGILQAILFFGIGGIAVDLPVLENALALSILSIAIVLTVITAGLFIASISKTEKQLNGLGTLFAILGAGIGGLMIPLDMMPDTMQNIAKLVPQNWALVGFQDIFVRNRELIDILPKVGMLLFFAMGFFIVGLTTYKRRFYN